MLDYNKNVNNVKYSFLIEVPREIDTDNLNFINFVTDISNNSYAIITVSLS